MLAAYIWSCRFVYPSIYLYIYIYLPIPIYLSIYLIIPIHTHTYIHTYKRVWPRLSLGMSDVTLQVWC